MVLKPYIYWDFNYQPQLVQDFSHQQSHYVFQAPSISQMLNGAGIFTYHENPKTTQPVL